MKDAGLVIITNWIKASEKGMIEQRIAIFIEIKLFTWVR
jgi:hypothetical protein